MKPDRLRALRQWLIWLSVVAIVTAVMVALRGSLEKADIALIYVLCVLVASSQVERFLALTLAFLTFLCFNFFLVPPRYTFAVEDRLDWLILVIYFITAAVGAQLLHRARTLAARAAALREADKLKDALLAAVSHDLRTPLTTIKAHAHDLHAQGSEPAGIIEEEADRLNGLVADLLDYSKLRGGAVVMQPQINAADDLIGAAIQQVSGTIDTADIRTHLQPGDPLLAGCFDFVHALRIVVNLLENAERYSGPRLPIDIYVRRVNGMLLFEVADRGRGIADADVDRIYEAFVQGSAAGPKGAGLGLSIARALAELQGGSLTHRKRDGGGTVFELRLPAVDTEEMG